MGQLACPKPRFQTDKQYTILILHNVVVQSCDAFFKDLRNSKKSALAIVPDLFPAQPGLDALSTLRV
jgi:hypothetical protein